MTVRTYPGARHEVLNETNRDEIIGELISWIDRVLADSRLGSRRGSEIPGRREQSAGEAAQLQPGKLFGGEPGDVGELIVADGRGTIDDRGLVHRGDIGGPAPVRVVDLVVRTARTSSKRTSRTSTPISSRVSRTAASAGDSPTSTAPPSTPHPSL